MELPTDIVPISSTADDAQLISSILDGHTEHFRLLTERYALDVKRIVGRMIPQAEDAEDVTQDTLMSAYESLPRYDSRRASFKTWLLRIAYHTVLKRLRSESHMQFVEVEQTRIDAIRDDDADKLLSDTSPDRLQLLDQAISQLSLDDQMLLSLYYHDDRPLREIAYIVNRTDSYLRSRLQWLRKKLCNTIITLETHGNK